MEQVPLVVAQSVRRLLDFRERARGALRLPASAGSGDGPLPLALAGRLFEDLAQAVGDAGVGLRVGAASRYEDVPLGRDVRGALTVGAALITAADASSRYCSGQRIWIARRDGTVRLGRRFPDALRRGRRASNDFALAMLIDLVRRAAGPGWRPDALHLEGAPPAHAEQLAALSAGPARFGSNADCLVFPERILALPLPRSPRPCDPTAAALPDEDFVASVRRAIRCLLAIGELSLADVAEAADMHARSLQRRLAESGLRFGELVDEVRFEVASRLLRDPAVRVTDVSVELGYLDTANFTRAFRRWAGVSPSAFRRAAAQQAGADGS